MKQSLLLVCSLALVSCASQTPKTRIPASIEASKSFAFANYKFKAYGPEFLSGPTVFDEPMVSGTFASSFDTYSVTEKGGCWSIWRKRFNYNTNYPDHKSKVCAGDPILVNGSQLEVVQVHQKYLQEATAVYNDSDIYVPVGVMIEFRDMASGKSYVTTDSSLNGFDSWGPNILGMSKSRIFSGFGKVESSMMSRHLSSKQDEAKAKEMAHSQLEKVCKTVTGGKISGPVEYSPVKLDNPGGIGDARFYRTTATGKCE